MASKEEMVIAVKAVQNGFIGPDVVQQCLDIQKQLADQGKDIPLIRIFEKKKVLDVHQLNFLKTGKGVSFDLDTKEGRGAIPQYKIVEELGQGGMATVFAAKSLKHQGHPIVALKVLFPHHYHNKKFIEGFLNEAQMLCQLNHENLVQGYDYGQAGGFYYMALEFVDGPSVQELVDDRGSLSEDLALHVILQVAKSLQYLGSVGITHRDIKPDNMLMRSDGLMKLIDLGFAKAGNAEEEDGVTCGTVQYISPEQARGRSDVDIRSDIYSLGATLYHLVIGEVPFQGEDSMDVMAKQVLEGLSSDKTKSGAISHHMHYFIEKMMAKEREIRYQSPDEVIEDIEGVVSGNKELEFNPNTDSRSSPLFDFGRKKAEEPERPSGRRRGPGRSKSGIFGGKSKGSRESRRGRRESEVGGRRSKRDSEGSSRRKRGEKDGDTRRSRAAGRRNPRTSRMRVRRKEKE